MPVWVRVPFLVLFFVHKQTDMYIISKKSEKDYYDGVAGTLGIDKTIVYNRHIQEVDLNDVPNIFKRKSSVYSKQDESPIMKMIHTMLKKEYCDKYCGASHFVIGFCGKLYPGWKFYKEIKNRKNFWDTEVSTMITYDSDFAREHFIESFWGNKFDDNLKYVKNYDPIEIFRLFDAPSFLFDADYKRTSSNMNEKTHKFLINPILKDYEFYTLFDSFQAFQEISMFLSGVLGSRENDIIQVEDKYKIAQHGFDKWSFRKPPENKQ